MVTIRLSRTGRKKAPSYRLVISEKGRDTLGRSLEILGHYHPLAKDDKDKIVINKERIEYWLGKGANTSSTVRNLLIDAGLIKGEKERTIGRRKSKKQLEEEKKTADAEKKVKSEDQPKADEPGAQKPAEESKEESKSEPKEDKKEEPKEEKKEKIKE